MTISCIAKLSISQYAFNDKILFNCFNVENLDYSNCDLEKIANRKASFCHQTIRVLINF